MKINFDSYETHIRDPVRAADCGQREGIRKLALGLGELAVRHVNVLLQLVQEEYAARIADIKQLFPKSRTSL